MTKRATSLLSGIATCILCACLPARAEDFVLSPSGFGTLGASYHHADGLEYRRSPAQKHGNRAGQVESGVDSIIGAQLNARTPWQVDGMAQAVSRQHANGSWKPELTWAFLRYAPNDDWQVRAGRLGLDTQLNADSRLVGYSLTTARPRPEEFASMPIHSFDGMDLRYRRPLGESMLSLKSFFGYFDGDFATRQGEAFKYPREYIASFSATLTYQAWQLRTTLGQTRAQDNGSYHALIDALHATGLPSASAAADLIQSEGKRTNVFALQSAYEQGPFSLDLSWLRTLPERNSAALPTTTSVAALMAYRHGNFKPYAGLARTSNHSRTVSSGLPQIGALAALEAEVQELNRYSRNWQQVLTLGVRHDIGPQLALKFQLDRIHARNSLTIFSKPERGDYASMTLYTICLDFIF